MSVEQGADQPDSPTVVSVRVVAAALWFISTLSFGLLYYVFDRTRRGQIFDIAAAVNVSEIEPSPQVWTNRVSDVASSWWLVIPLLLLVTLGLWGRRPVVTIALLGAGGVGMILSTVLKDQLPWRSLRSGDGVTWLAYNSLPSGRATAAMAIGLAGIALTRRSAGAAALIGMIFPVAVGVSAIVAGFHKPSDIVAAYVMVGGLYFAAIAATAGRRMVPFGITERRLAVGSLSVGVAGLVVAAVAIVGIHPSRFVVTMDDGRPIYEHIPIGPKTIAITWALLVFSVGQMVAVSFFIVSGVRPQNHQQTPDLPLPLRP